MATTIGPKMKRVRRLGEEFAMAGNRSTAAKYVKLHRKQPPGMHGKKAGFAKLTSYGQQLREKQKARAFYHLTAKQLRSYYTAAGRQHGSTDTILLVELERRLDNVVYRAGWTDSHRSARQLVSHGHLTANGRKIDVPSYQVRTGDVIAFSSNSSALKTKIQDVAKGNSVPSWLKTDPDKLTIEIVNLPVRDEIEVPFNEKIIVEFYSR
jgi:small subunit ribosomal protein S4